MKRHILLLVIGMLGALFLTTVLNTSASTGGTANLNARFTHWQGHEHVIHLILEETAVVVAGQPVLFGFEWVAPDETVAFLQELIVDNPDHDIRLSIDGGPEVSVKNGYQDAFFAETNNGPAWSWDHDGDGPGDGDGDGWDDWNGPTVFFRYQPEGSLTPGTHTFAFILYDDGIPTHLPLVTVEVVAE